ncbi:hypothetical protein SUGI_0594020 [Cryptomeria japonica]|uniref:uncharacterized protein LOC131074800 n=1 Tax=Cryptomeria japonica TaxID=3369 RepID=UPI0024149E5F|nr:uncharacterized protein LOC131074800 [Cryptomeria japonica]GLJ30040.1 hypothetical protein SUGI_0594020 [Cryptomeria japonica]
MDMEMELNKGKMSASSIIPPRLEDAGLEDCALSTEGIREAFLRAAEAVKSTIFNEDDGDCIEDGGPSNGEWTDELQDYSTDEGKGDHSCVEPLVGGLVEEGKDKVVEIGVDGDVGDDLVDSGLPKEKHPGEEDGDGGCVPGLKGLLPDPPQVEKDDGEKKEEGPTLAECYV